MKKRIGRVLNLGSSSKGNAFYIEIFREGYPNPFKLLVECGFDINTIRTRLLDKGISVNDLDAILITHEHQDHAKSVVDFVKMNKRVFAPRSVFERYGLLEQTTERFIIKEKTHKAIGIGIDVLGMPLDHENDDGSPTYNLGYIITIEYNYRILFVTDTKHIRWDLSNYQFNMIFIEANNLRRVIHFALKGAKESKNRGLQIHFNRVLNSHMLVEKTAKTLTTFDLSKCEVIILTHLSANLKTNPFEFKKIVLKKLRENNKLRKVIKKQNGKIIEEKILPKVLVATEKGSIE